MALKRITAPDTTPVTLDDAKAHLRIDHTGDDAMIELYLAAATAHVDGKEGWLQRALKPQTWELTYDEFPAGGIEIPLPPLISIEAVEYVDEDGVTQTIDAANYEVDTDSEPGWLMPVDDYVWPTTLDTINAVRVRFIAGYPDEEGVSDPAPSTVPAPIKAAILMMVADMYEHRETVSPDAISEIPVAAAVKGLLSLFRVFI